ncbi:hypothetical protein ACP70R_011655 [Stipagrostis hirtigluma subsp. patula]
MEGSGTRAAAAGEDRLSALPDCLLHTILSRITSQQAVQTCVLSRRWRHLWRGVPCIDLDDSEYRSTGDLPRRYREETAWDRFEEFADNLLIHRGAGAGASPLELDTFRLCVADAYLMRTNYLRWLRRGIKLSPAALHVRHRSGRCRFDLYSLSPGCRRLTRLRLDNVTLAKELTEQLGALFPVLEDLDLRDCQYYCSSWMRFQIASGTVKNLAIDNCRHDSSDGIAVAIVAPRLASLRLTVPLYYSDVHHTYTSFTAYTVQGDGGAAAPPPSLAAASIRVVDTGRYLEKWPQLEYNVMDPTFARNMAFLESLPKLLGSASGASRLELSGLRSAVVEKKGYVVLAERFVSVPILQAILDQDEQHQLPVFGNLRRLVLGECDLGDDLQALWRILEHTPALENLYLRHCKLPDYRATKRARNWLGAVASNLKLVEIEYQDDPRLAAMPEEYKEERARRFYEVLWDISRELRTTVKAIPSDHQQTSFCVTFNQHVQL